jgi:predicted nucleic acid-binding Zn ribbon protein
VIFKGSGFYQTDYKNAGSSSSGGGCQPTCGTSDAPAGCKMGKKG